MALDAKMDENSRQTLTALSSTDHVSIVQLYADPVTHRLLTDAAGGTGTVTNIATGAGLTGGPITTTGTIALNSKLSPLDTLGTPGQAVRVNGAGTALEYFTIAGTGTVTSVSVASANGFTGTVANATTTPAITLTTSITGVLKGNGTAISAASDGTDYLSSTTGVTLDQTVGQTIGATGARLTKLWATDITVTNAIAGSITGNASSATNSTNVGITDDTTTNAVMYPTWVTANTGNLPEKVSSTKMVFNPSLGRLATIAMTIGTANIADPSAADAALDIFGTTNAIIHAHNVGAQGATAGAAIIAYSIPSAAMTTGSRLGAFVSGGSKDVSNTLYNSTAISSFAAENWSSTAGGSKITFEVTPNTTVTRAVALTIEQDKSATFAGTVSGTTYSATDATTPSFSTASGKTNTGNVTVNGKTNGSLIITTADATAQAVTLTTAAQTVGAATLTIPNMANVNKTVAWLESPSFTTPSLGAATATSINGNTFTTGTYTLTGTASKTLNFTNSLTLSGTDSTTMTFPTTSATIARTDAAQTFTGTQTFAQIVTTSNAITASGNAATVPITSRISTVTNNSAATLTITITTTSAVDGQLVQVRVLDFSAAAQTITWVNTEDSTVTAPTTSNGSTTLPLTVGFQYNNATSKWRCIAKA